MKITEVHVDHFGVLDHLSVGDLDAGLNLVQVPDRAAAADLRRFLRFMLYGAPAPSPRSGDDARDVPIGGVLGIASGARPFRLERYLRGANTPGGRPSLRLTDSAGRVHDDQQLTALLGRVDEATFSELFVVSRADLEDEDRLRHCLPALLLPSRKARHEQRQLERAERALSDAPGRPPAAASDEPRLRQLMARYMRLGQQLRQNRQRTRRYVELSGQLARLSDRRRRGSQLLARLQRALAQLGAPLAPSATGPQAARDPRTAATAGGGLTATRFAADAARASRIRRSTQRIADAQRQLRQLRLALAKSRGRAHARTGPTEGRDVDARLQALLALELELPLAEFPTQAPPAPPLPRTSSELVIGPSRVEPARVGVAAAEAVDVTAALAGLRPAARRLRAAMRRRRARLEQRRLGPSAFPAAADVEAGPTVRSRRSAAQAASSESLAAGPGSAAGKAGETSDVDAPRTADRRLEPRIVELQRTIGLLRSEARQLETRQLPRPSVALGLATLFSAGIAMLLAGLALPARGAEWALVGTGLVCAVSAAFLRVSFARVYARRLSLCRQRMRAMHDEIEQLRLRLDVRRPVANIDSAAARLLARQLEQAAARRGQRTAHPTATTDGNDLSSADITAAGQHAPQALRAARRTWQRTLVRHGLPAGLSPKQAFRYLRSAAQDGPDLGALAPAAEPLPELPRHETLWRQDCAATWQQHARQLLSELGEVPVPDSLPGQLTALRELAGRRAVLRRRAQQSRRRARRLASQAQRASERLRRCRKAHHRLLRTQPQTAPQPPAAASSGRSPSDAQTHRATERRQILERRRERIAGWLSRQESAGSQWALEQKSLGDDRRLAAARLERAQVRTRLQRLVGDLAARGLTRRGLQELRHRLKRRGQPEGLQIAGGLLSRATQGRLTSIRRKGAHSSLVVAGPGAAARALERLDATTRRLAVLCLRLATIRVLARHGVDVPVLLDESLLDENAVWSLSAAGVLDELAEAGHQVVLIAANRAAAERFHATTRARWPWLNSASAEAAPVPKETHSKSAATPAAPTQPGDTGTPPPAELAGDDAYRVVGPIPVSRDARELRDVFAAEVTAGDAKGVPPRVPAAPPETSPPGPHPPGADSSRRGLTRVTVGGRQPRSANGGSSTSQRRAARLHPPSPALPARRLLRPADPPDWWPD